MALNSINTNVAAMQAQSNIGKASNMAGSSIARLSSGNRITRAADDVAAMSAGTSLRTNVTTLKTALVNTSQGQSMLQVADGALNQVVDILQRQKSIAVQAGSGSLTSAERSFLNQEFQNLSQEIDRLVSQTNFNGVTLLDGSLSERVSTESNAEAAKSASTSVTFSANIAAADVITLNGQDFTAGAAAGAGIDFVVGGTLTESIDNMVTALNASTDVDLSSATYSRSGNSLVITSDNGGVQGEKYTITTQNANAIINGGTASSVGLLFGADLTTAELDDSIAAAVATAAEPLQGGVAEITSGAINLLGAAGTTVAVGETLQSLADRINANTDASGFTARIVGSTGAYNIQVETTDIATPPAAIAISGVNDASAAVPAAATPGILAPTGVLNDNVLQFGATFTSSTTSVTAAVVGAATPFEDAQEIQVDGTTIATLATGDSMEDIVTKINANAGTTGFSATLEGTGVAGDLFNINISTLNVNAAGAVTFTGTAPDPTDLTIDATIDTTENIFSLDDATDPGIGAGDTVGVGTIGDNIITNQNQQNAEVTLSFPEIADADLLTATNFGGANAPSFTVAGVTISFTQDGDGPAEAAIGATLEETLDNAVATFNAYQGTGAEMFTLNQVEAYRDGTDIKIRSNDVGSATLISGAAANVTLANAPTGASVSGTGVFDNGTTGGITTTGITNDKFIGTISGFQATFTGTADTVDLSIKVGESTYAATAVNINNADDATIRLSSEDGGYFDVQLAGNNGEAVTSQTAANRVAERLDGAFSSITFSQERAVTSYNGNSPIVTNGVVTGSLIGTSVDIQGSDFSDVRIDSIRVNEPEGISPNGTIEITLNGQSYKADNDLTAKLGANQTYRLTSTVDSNSYIDFTTGDTAIEFDTKDKAQAFEQSLREAFGVSKESSAVAFQVGVTTTDTLNISVNNVSTREIFGGENLDVLTKESAAAAADAIDAAIDQVTAVRAEVGALQSRFDFAAANVESSIQNQDAARGVLLDTDIAAESTAFSTAQVQLQAGISVLAQANLLPQNLLKLIG